MAGLYGADEILLVYGSRNNVSVLWLIYHIYSPETPYKILLKGLGGKTHRKIMVMDNYRII